MDINHQIVKVGNFFVKVFLGTNILFVLMILVLLLDPKNKFLNSLSEVSLYIIPIIWTISLLGTVIFTILKSKFGLQLIKIFKINDSIKRLSGLTLLIFSLISLSLFGIFLYFSKKNNIVSENASLIKVFFFSSMFFIPFGLIFLTRKLWKMFFILISIAMAIFIILATVLSPFKIRGDSMTPALRDGQFVFSNNISYFISQPERGDLVFYKSPYSGNTLIGRIVGLPNETVYVSRGKVYINDKVLSEPYTDTSNITDQTVVNDNESIKLQDHSYFILGDNRNSISGSQTVGSISISKIVGKVFIIYWPLSDFGQINTSMPEISQSRFMTEAKSTAIPTSDSEPSLSCKTLGTKMVLQPNGYGQIGCDIETNGEIDLIRSYCISESSHQTDILRPDAYGKENGYYVTLYNLFPNEKVHVYAFDLKGNKIECLPALN